MNLNLPKYAWAQGLVVALHSMLLAVDNKAGCKAMPFNEAAEQLDSFRRVRKLTMIPQSSYYLSNCRTLRIVEASGPTAVSGWRRYVDGEPFVRARNISLIGDSGAHIYGSSGQSHQSVLSSLVSHSRYAKAHDLTYIGAHPRRWLDMLTEWENRHLQYALAQSGKPGDPPYFGVSSL